MEAPSSSILSEVYLQYVEHTVIYDILLRSQILGYFRYVDDILIVYDADLTNINEVLSSFNDATPTVKFTVEEEKNNQINFWISRSEKTIIESALISKESLRLRTSLSLGNPVIT
jgi:hypothetical protein